MEGIELEALCGKCQGFGLVLLASGDGWCRGDGMIPAVQREMNANG
jgi:hypothetical protein